MLFTFGAILVMFKFLELLRALPAFGAFIGLIFKIIADLVPFLVVLGSLMLGFSFSFYALLGPRWDLTSKFVADGPNATKDDEIGYDVFPYSDDERDLPRPFWDTRMALLTSYQMMLGDFDMDIFARNKGDFYAMNIAIVLFVVFSLLVFIVLLNVLIAIVSDTYAGVMSDRDVEGRIAQADVVLEIELMHVRTSRVEEDVERLPLVWHRQMYESSSWVQVRARARGPRAPRAPARDGALGETRSRPRILRRARARRRALRFLPQNLPARRAAGAQAAAAGARRL